MASTRDIVDTRVSVAKFRLQLAPTRPTFITHLFPVAISLIAKHKSGTNAVIAFEIHYTLFKNTTLKEEISITQLIMGFN